MKTNSFIDRLSYGLGIRSEFQALFFRNEFSTLAGKSWLRILSLTFILFATCLALSFVLGSLELLKKRMDDPFTNWVDIPIGRMVLQETVDAIKSDFNDPKLRDKFRINSVKGYVIWQLRLLHQKSNEIYYRSGRTIELNEDLAKKILEPANLVSYPNGKNILNEEECAVIVNEKLLLELGYKNPYTQQKLVFEIDERLIAVKIAAIVKYLPNKCEFVGSESLFAMLNQSFIDDREENFIEFIAASIDDEVDQRLNALFPNNKIVSTAVEPYAWNSKRSYAKYRINFEDDYTFADRVKLLKSLKKNKRLSAFDLIDPACQSTSENIEPYYLAINFSGDLRQIKPFQDYVQSNYDQVEISMDQIESKNNFALVSSLTFITSLAFFIFGIISIGFYLFSLLKTHLDRLKPNLGTFKAFGLSDAFLTGIYVQIIVIFLSIAICISVLLCGFITLMDGLVSVEPHFRIFDWRLLLAITALFIGGVVICRNIVKKILMDTPGNLIYGRD